MKKALLSLIAATAAMFVSAAPAPYPLPINSQAQTAPPVLVYRGSECSFRVAFTDGSAASDITGCIPFLAWSTNALATGVSTSSYTIVSATNGIVDFHFDQSAVNFTAGRYLYEVGVRSNAVPRVYRQGVFTIYGSPVGAGVNAVTWSTPVNWQLIDWSNLPTLTINGVTGSIGTNLSFTVTGSGGGSVTSVNGQTGTVTITAALIGAITNENDSIALSALSTNRATRLFDTTGTRWIDGTGGVYEVSYTLVTDAIHLDFSTDAYLFGECIPADATIPTSTADQPCGEVLATVSGSGFIFKSLFNPTTKQLIGFFPFPPTYPHTVNFSTPNIGSVTFSQVYTGVTSALPRVAFVSDVPSTNGILSATGDGSGLTGITAAQVGALTNISVNGTIGSVSDGVASVTVTASSNTNKMWIPLTAAAGVNIASNATAGITVTTLGLPLYMGERKICIKRASTNLADTFTVQLTSIGYSRQTITSAVPINVSGAIITVPAFANNGNLFRAETVPGDGPPAATPSVSADVYLVPTAATLSAGAVSVWFLDE